MFRTAVCFISQLFNFNSIEPKLDFSSPLLSEVCNTRHAQVHAFACLPARIAFDDIRAPTSGEASGRQLHVVFSDVPPWIKADLRRGAGFTFLRSF